MEKLDKELRRYKNLYGYQFYSNLITEAEEVETGEVEKLPPPPNMGQPEGTNKPGSFGGEQTNQPNDNLELAPEPNDGEIKPVEVSKKTEEIDITTFINKVGSVLDKVEKDDQTIQQLFATVQGLETKLQGMEQSLGRLNNIEAGIKELLPPTPEERLDLISLDSYPYNVKLDDYWRKKGYDLEKRDEATKDYELTKDDIENYNENEMRDSLNIGGASNRGQRNYRF